MVNFSASSMLPYSCVALVICLALLRTWQIAIFEFFNKLSKRKFEEKIGCDYLTATVYQILSWGPLVIVMIWLFHEINASISLK